MSSVYRILFNKKYLKHPDKIPKYVLQHVAGDHIDRFGNLEHIMVDQESNHIMGINQADVNKFIDEIIGEVVDGAIMTPEHLNLLSDANLLVRKIGLKMIYDDNV